MGGFSSLFFVYSLSNSKIPKPTVKENSVSIRRIFQLLPKFSEFNSKTAKKTVKKTAIKTAIKTAMTPTNNLPTSALSNTDNFCQYIYLF